jgi:hypothetical protein
MNEKQLRTIQIIISVIALGCLISLFFYIYTYKSIMLSNPCEYIGNHSPYRCVANPDEYICACNKYYKVETLTQMNLSKLIENATTEYLGETNGD